MFKLPRRMVVEWKCCLFSLWRLCSPRGNYRSKISCIKREINKDWLAACCIIRKQHSSLPLGKGEGKRQGEACLLLHQKHRSRAGSKVPNQRMLPPSSRDVEQSCWVISALHKSCQLDISSLADTEHPWGKDTDPSFVYSIGGDVLPGFDQCFQKL